MNSLVIVAVLIGACVGIGVWWFYAQLRPGRPWLGIALPLALLGICLAIVVITINGGGDYLRDGLTGFMIVFLVWVGSGKFHATK